MERAKTPARRRKLTELFVRKIRPEPKAFLDLGHRAARLSDARVPDWPEELALHLSWQRSASLVADRRRRCNRASADARLLTAETALNVARGR